MKTTKERLIKIVDTFSEQRILVIGDLMLDRYLWCSVERISPEAPVPIAKIENETIAPGGAANAVNNLCDLGSKVRVVGLVGDDKAGNDLIQYLNQKKVDTSGIIVDPSRPTTLKTRIMSGHHHMLRLDHEKNIRIEPHHEKELFKRTIACLKDIDIFVISDYAKGLISKEFARKSIDAARKLGIRVLVDPTPNNILMYQNSYMIKPNKKEAENITGIKIDQTYSNLDKVGNRIIKMLNAKIVIVTLGKDGMAIFDSQGRSYRIPCIDYREAVDVSGAGDTTMAALATSLSCGASLRDSVVLANICAGIAVSKPGTTTCTLKELKNYINKYL